jgi:acetyltransferase
MIYSIHRYPAELIDVMHLPNERRLIIRPVLPQDAAIIQAFIRDLSERSRRNRFFRTLHELPENLLEQFTHIDYFAHMALVAEIFEDRAETIVGEARYVTGTDGHTAELALAVGDAWQGHGIGRLLLERLISRASDQGIVLLHGQILPSNDAMLSLAGSAGFSLRPDPEEPKLVRMERRLKPGNTPPMALQWHCVGHGCVG